MMPTRTDIEKLSSDFESCRKILCAIGDENRQHLILEMMKELPLRMNLPNFLETSLNSIIVPLLSWERNRTKSVRKAVSASRGLSTVL